MLESARALQEQLTSWRRDIHMHPELGFQEHRTSRLVADELQAMGLRVKTGVGKTGVVGYIGQGKPVIGIRADMDALPIQETNDVPYASQVPGVMHACGHDSHTAMLLGVARLLSTKTDRPPGEIRLLFQPCEEAWDEEFKSGAVRMIEDGALAGVDAVIGLHVASHFPAGKVMVDTGYVSAAVDDFQATIIGTGGHGAYPHLTTDPIFIFAQVINIIYGIRARRIDPTRPAVISVGSVHAGDAENVIPGELKLGGTIRSFDEETRQALAQELEDALAVARAMGGDYTLDITKGYPSLYNDPKVTAIIHQVAVEMLGEDALLPIMLGMGAEDFSYMAREAPGAMFTLGAKLDEVARPHHSPVFDLDETAFPVGAALLAETACRLLKEKASG
jgi:amidohydrolase